MELLIDAVTRHETMSFIDGSSDHLGHLRKVFDRLRKFQLKMNPLKCVFGVAAGKFLGFTVRHRGIEIEQAKIDDIM
nr:DNA-directed DNA polymerase [Ipomoea batatas]